MKPWEAKWKIVGDLRRGAQGSTHLVDSASQPAKTAVLKILNNAKSQQARARMHKEVTSLGTLANIGVKVPHVYDGNTELYQHAAIPLYFVMELIPGNTLAEEIRARGKIPPETALAMTLDLCSTIASAHNENVFHRDIKPDNIGPQRERFPPRHQTR
jgi:eukaryotic-like serine/threonine-protein kinase